MRFFITVAAIAGINLILTLPSPALEIDLGGSAVDLDNNNSDRRTRVSIDGHQVDVEVYKEPELETRKTLATTVEQEPERELIELSVPVE
ncbi:MAG: hypothetical protein ACFB2W_24680 [Leptolyngbyaceae cyanobacterium]